VSKTRNQLLDIAHRLKAQGIPTAEIARQLKLPVSTLKDHLKRTLPAKTTDVYNGGTTEVHQGSAANVHIDIPLSNLADFQEVLAGCVANFAQEVLKKWSPPSVE
jgi:hypothetical protein